jgi:hypothetical protein
MKLGLDPRRRPVLCAFRFATGPCLRQLAAVTCCAVFALMTSPAASDLEAVQKTVEWARLAKLWNLMLDHSSDVVYSPTHFNELAESLDAADGDLTALAKSGLLPEETASALRRLFHGRYDYIKTYHYTNQQQINQTAAESAASTARWLVERQLALLRSGSLGPQVPEEILTATRSNIAFQLTFLHHLDQFEAEVERRRGLLEEKRRAGEEADLESFDNECQRKRNLLLEAYRNRRIRSLRVVEALIPYVLALNDARSTGSAAL